MQENRHWKLTRIFIIYRYFFCTQGKYYIDVMHYGSTLREVSFKKLTSSRLFTCFIQQHRAHAMRAFRECSDINNARFIETYRLSYIHKM